MISIKNKIVPDVSERCWYPHGKVCPTTRQTIYIELSNKKLDTVIRFRYALRDIPGIEWLG
jgi:hypothetical protein